MVAAVHPAPPDALAPLFTPPPTAPGLRGARALARAYDAHVAACWRGEADGAAFGNWLGQCRCPEVVIPPGPPAAVSPHGAGGRGLAWYDVPGAILGSAVGVAWGYRVPLGAVPPEATTATGAVPHEAGNARAAGAADGLIEEDGYVIVGRAGQRVRRPLAPRADGRVGLDSVPGATDRPEPGLGVVHDRLTEIAAAVLDANRWGGDDARGR